VLSVQTARRLWLYDEIPPVRVQANVLTRSAADPLAGFPLDRTCDVEEQGIAVRADELDCTNDDNDNHCQHHAVVGNVLCSSPGQEAGSNFSLLWCTPKDYGLRPCAAGLQQRRYRLDTGSPVEFGAK